MSRKKGKGKRVRKYSKEWYDRQWEKMLSVGEKRRRRIAQGIIETLKEPLKFGVWGLGEVTLFPKQERGPGKYPYRIVNVSSLGTRVKKGLLTGEDARDLLLESFLPE